MPPLTELVVKVEGMSYVALGRMPLRDPVRHAPGQGSYFLSQQADAPAGC